jgi:hypothetical protein
MTTSPTRHNWISWGSALCFSAALCFAASPCASGQQPGVWKTGPQFQKQLDAPLSLTWSERQLADGLRSLSQSVGVAIFLDRRIDPSQSLELTAPNEPLQLVLAKIGGQVKARVTSVGACVYLGPAQTADNLSTVAALRRGEVAALPAEAKQRLLRSQAWQWSELAEPRQLLADLARQASVTVQNPEQIPHDLWPAQSLPPLPWVDRLSLLLAGFGLTFEIGGQGTLVRLVPLPATAALEKTYSTRGDAADLALQLRRIVPQAAIRTETGKLHVSASQDDHDKIERLLAGQSVKTVKPVKPGTGGGEKRYTLTVENQPAGAVLKTVAGALGKELKYDEALLEKLNTNVSFTVKDVPLDELLKKTLQPLGLAYRLDEKALEVIAP